MPKINSPLFRFRMLGLGLLALTCTLLPACGPTEENVPLYPVSGKVLNSGSPMPIGQVMFYPDQAKGNSTTKVPSGMIQADGSYSLTTGTSKGVKEGAPAGWYKVTVSAAGTGTPEQMKVKPAFYNPDFKNAKLTKLSIEVKEGAGPKDYEIKLTP